MAEVVVWSSQRMAWCHFSHEVNLARAVERARRMQEFYTDPRFQGVVRVPFAVFRHWGSPPAG